MKVLITGATGHLGACVVREALADGHQVRALARASSNRLAVEGLDIEVAMGDLLDRDSLRAAADGQDLVLHVAAVHRAWAEDEEEAIFRPAVEGTENMLRAAADAGVKRVVHTSSNATVGYPKKGEPPFDETHFMKDAHSTYIRAKCAAEQLALELGRELGLELVVTNPCGIFGPWDLRLTPSSRAIVGMAEGGPAVLDVAMTHVEDVARGTLLAAEKGRDGERYLLGGDNVSAAQTAELMTELTGRTIKSAAPPKFLMRLFAWNEVRKARKNGTDAAITNDQITDVWGCSLFYDSTKAKSELGWNARGARETLLDALAWLAVRKEIPEDVASHVLGLREPDPSWPSDTALLRGAGG